MTPPSEHWLDRLAAPHTRRQGLKAALGAAVLTMPILRAVPAAAQGGAPGDCRQGCIWTAKQDFGRAIGACRADETRQACRTRIGCLFSGMLKFNTHHSPCADKAVANYYAGLKVCDQPFCPGFDKNKPGGPCDGCDPPLSCNPCSDVDPGYICCVYPMGDCHGDCCPSHPAPGCP